MDILGRMVLISDFAFLKDPVRKYNVSNKTLKKYLVLYIKSNMLFSSLKAMLKLTCVHTSAVKHGPDTKY